MQPSGKSLLCVKAATPPRFAQCPLCARSGHSQQIQFDSRLFTIAGAKRGFDQYTSPVIAGTNVIAACLDRTDYNCARILFSVACPSQGIVYHHCALAFVSMGSFASHVPQAGFLGVSSSRSSNATRQQYSQASKASRFHCNPHLLPI